jgi:hypothetical protein
MAALSATTLSHTAAVSLPATASLGATAAASGGDTVPNGGSTVLFMNNTAGASATVTVTTTSTSDGLDVADRVFTVPANTVQIVKLGPVSVYGTSTRVDCSATTVRLLAFTV